MVEEIHGTATTKPTLEVVRVAESTSNQRHNPRALKWTKWSAKRRTITLRILGKIISEWSQRAMLFGSSISNF
jgi:hypothetical protein